MGGFAAPWRHGKTKREKKKKQTHYICSALLSLEFKTKSINHFTYSEKKPQAKSAAGKEGTRRLRAIRSRQHHAVAVRGTAHNKPKPYNIRSYPYKVRSKKNVAKQRENSYLTIKNFDTFFLKAFQNQLVSFY